MLPKIPSTISFTKLDLKFTMGSDCAAQSLSSVPEGTNVMICVRYHIPITIVNDNFRVVNKLETSLTDDARVLIYDRDMFATGLPI
jgi:hypothetical protein